MPRTYPRGGIPLVRRYVRKRTYSTPDRVLIHLSSEALRPEEQTQGGIALATQSGRSTLTKWLDRLEDRGLVKRERIRLDGHPLPRYAYRLTPRGWRVATSLRQKLASQVITVRAPTLGRLSVRVAEVPSLASTRIDLTRALSSVHKGQLDLVRTVPPTPYQSPLVWGNCLRRVDRFFGRTMELKSLGSWWASESPVLFVTGLPGIGKSALVATWVREQTLRVPVYGFEIHPSTTAAGLLADFSGFLASLGKPSLAAYLTEGAPLELAFIYRLLERELSGLRLLVVLDNVDQASRDVSRLLSAPFTNLLSRIAVKLILLSRSSTGPIRTLQRSTPSSRLIRIRGLDRNASVALLRYRGLGGNPTHIEDLIRATRGHPFLLHLAASSGPTPGLAVQRYLEEEVWDTLSDEEQSVLEMLSVFREAVGNRVLETMGNAAPRTLDRLCERNLLERTVRGGLVMHDLVKGFVEGRMTESRRRDLHGKAARPMLRATDPRERWEGVYHLLEAGRAGDAAAFLDSEGAPLLDSVAAEEIASLVRGFALDETDTDAYCIFAEILGDSLRVRGHLGPALHQYAHARNRAEASRREERVPRLLRKMAFIERCRNEYPKALGYLVEARARLTEEKDPAEMTEVLREMALVEQAAGELAKAAGYLNEAVDLATETSDPAALSRTLLALGSLETSRGNRQQGLDASLEGFRIAQRSANLTEVAHAHIVVGTALAEMERFEEARRHFQRGTELARLLGNLRLLAYGTFNLAAILVDLERYQEAAGPLRDAEGYFDILEEEDTRALLEISAGQREMALGHWSRAQGIWQACLTTLRRTGNPIDLARALKSVASYRVKQGDLEGASRDLLEAWSVSNKLRNPRLLAEIEASLRRLGVTQAP